MSAPSGSGDEDDLALGRRPVSGPVPTLGGNGNRVVPLVAGALTGAVAVGALLIGGRLSVDDAAAHENGLDLLGCPAAGSVVAIAGPGDRLWVTGKTADGTWLRVFLPGPTTNEGWAPASRLAPLAEGSSVPVVACGQVAGGARVSARRS
jgi:hypothetical protein